MALDNILKISLQVGGDEIAIGLFLGIFDGHDEPFGLWAQTYNRAPYHRYDLNTTSDADGEGPRMGGKIVSDVLVPLATPMF